MKRRDLLAIGALSAGFPFLATQVAQADRVEPVAPQDPADTIAALLSQSVDLQRAFTAKVHARVESGWLALLAGKLVTAGVPATVQLVTDGSLDEAPDVHTGYKSRFSTPRFTWKLDAADPVPAVWTTPPAHWLTLLSSAPVAVVPGGSATIAANFDAIVATLADEIVDRLRGVVTMARKWEFPGDPVAVARVALPTPRLQVQAGTVVFSLDVALIGSIESTRTVAASHRA